MKVIVAGSRSVKDYETVSETIRDAPYEITELVSGGAVGADRFGERFARWRNIPIKQFLPNWDIGKHAGFLRNAEMADYADALIAVWDGQSKGTAHMIKTMQDKGKPVHVYEVPCQQKKN